MPRFHVHDNARRAYTDQEAAESMVSQIMERLDRLEQAVIMLAQGGDNGNGEEMDQQPTEPTTKLTPTTTTPAGELKPGQRMGDELLPKGNLSRVDPDAYQSGMRWPMDKSRVGA